MTEIYTDGGYRAKYYIGAWAYIVVQDNSVIHTASESVSNTTNNEMELTAILHALEYIGDRREINAVIYSDSMYAVRCINEWYQQWCMCNTVTGKKNIELISSVYRLAQSTRTSIAWVKGHADNQFNKTADRLVNDAMDKVTL